MCIHGYIKLSVCSDYCMFRDDACIYAEVQDTQRDVDMMLQQNDAYSTQMLPLKQNVCYESFSGVTFQPQQYENDTTRKPAEFVHLVILSVFDCCTVQN